MFDNPILFALLIGTISSLVYFFLNKEKDKQDKNPNKNTKYLVIFAILFIISLIGKICYNGKILDNIDDRVNNMLGGSSLSVNDTDISNVDNVIPPTSESPPF
tara:strand:- start:821 stop:1129 length:309 start_codon:yes stop_codon:yes gene_type:complete